MSHSAGLATSVDGGSGSEMISQEPEINSEEEEGERIFNNFAENRNLSLRKDRQRDAPGMWLTAAIINIYKKIKDCHTRLTLFWLKKIKCLCCNLVCHGFTLVIMAVPAVTVHFCTTKLLKDNTDCATEPSFMYSKFELKGALS
jgi:hypothetical protein